MVRKEIEGRKFFPSKDAEEGDALEGIYEGSEERLDGNGLDYRVKTADGNVYVNGVVIAGKLKDIELGTKVFITFIGMKKSKNKMLYKDFKVEIDQ